MTVSAPVPASDNDGLVATVGPPLWADAATASVAGFEFDEAVGTQGAGGAAGCDGPEAFRVRADCCCNATSAACVTAAMLFGAGVSPAFASETVPRLSCCCPAAFAPTFESAFAT